MNILRDEEFKRKFPIFLVEHNEDWKLWYKEEKLELEKKLNNINFNIYHVGSTALNIKAKNIVDIIIEIFEEDDFIIALSVLKNAWSFRWHEDNQAFFVKGYNENGFDNRVFHLHLRNKGDIDEVYFRDYLLAHPQVAKEYEKLKLSLAQKYKNDREKYTESKSDFIKKYTTIAKKQKQKA